MGSGEAINQGGGCSEQSGDYLKRAAEACEQGNDVLGMHLYLAAYENAAADPEIPDGMALAGLREAWHLACELKERSMAEYVFEKLEPYLSGDEIAACAEKLQSLALDRLEEYGFSREELEDMAEMISQDFIGGDASVVKVESISIPGMGMFGVPAEPEAGEDVVEVAAEVEEGLEDDADRAAFDQAAGEETGLEEQARTAGSEAGIGVAQADDFNPYDQYRDYSIGKSYHAATNEGSGAPVFTRDADRAAAHDRFVSGQAEPAGKTGDSQAPGQVEDAHGEASRKSEPANGNDSQSGQADAAAGESSAITPGKPAQPPKKAVSKAPRKAAANVPVPAAAPGDSGPLNYRSLVGYESAVSTMRDFGIGLQNDRGFRDFISLLNEQHGLDRPPALDTILLRAPVLEDATRFLEATIGEIGLPALRMTMEESIQGAPMLCVMTQGNHRPRMNHAQNSFEAPAILVLENLESWYMPQPPEGVEGIPGFVMANISRGAREAVNLIRSAVEDPDVYVLATCATDGEVDPFFYDMLEPMTVVDIEDPSDNDRVEIWTEIARNHPSMRMVNRADLMRLSKGLSRYDMYMAARDAIEEAYKTGIAQRSYIPVTPTNVFEKLAACHPLESDEYRMLEDEVVAGFKRELENLDDLLGEAQD